MTNYYGEINLKLKLWVKYLIFAVFAAIICVFDQFTKWWIVDITNATEGKGITVIDKVLKFTYIKNDGASMGLFSGQQIFLIVMTVAVFAIGAYYMVKNRPESPLLLSAVALIASGAVGNLIDRIRLGYVVDFIDLQFVKFYIFNVADCAICIGAGILILYAFRNVKD